MRISIAICDDNKEILSILTAAIESEFSKYKCSFNIDSYSSVNELREKTEEKRYLVFFLDIDMPEMDGITFAQHLREKDNDACIIYISNKEERVFDTFKVRPMDFIRKSCFHEEIASAVKDINQWIENIKKAHLVVETQGRLTSVLVYNILYVECISKTQNIVLGNTTITVKYTLSYLEDKLRGYGFLKPHKGFLVNYKFIERIEKNCVYMTNGERIPLSKYRHAEIKQSFLRLISE